MAECPFCKDPISEEIARFGGICGSCLIEIPGDETATNPGERTGATQKPSKARGPIISSLVAAAVVLVGVGIWHTQKPEPVSGEKPERRTYSAIPLSSHQDQLLPEELEAAAAAEAAAATAAADAEHKREKRSEKRNRTGGMVPEADQQVAEGRVIPKAAAPVVNPLDAFAEGSGPKKSVLQGIVLKDGARIQSMVARVLDRGNGRLHSCYLKVAKSQPGYKGVWRVDVDISKAGRVEGLDVSAVSGANSTMERCIRGQVSRWTFQRIAFPVSSGITYRFGR